MKKTNEELRSLILKTRESNRRLFEPLPDKAVTQGQKELEAKHGTPKAFADACNMAVGEITCMEAHIAIEKYKQEWREAK